MDKSERSASNSSAMGYRNPNMAEVAYRASSSRALSPSDI